MCRFALCCTDRATFLRHGLLVACAAMLCAGFSGDAGAAPRQNFVVLLCDDLGYGDLSCFAHPVIRTPNLDRLASEGVKLTHCYSSSPVCSPSRAGLMTGRNHNRLGIRDWIPAGSGIYLRPGEVTMAQLLKQAGYRTCHVGKWHLNSRTNGSEPTPGDAGFDYWLYTQNNAAPSHLDPTNFIRNGKRAGPLKGPSSHILVEEAIRWLDTVGGEPFFLNVWFHETHEPVAAAEEFLELYPGESNLDKRHYYGDVSQMDAAVGKLMKYLDDRGLRESTLVFFSSDNGPETLKRYPAGRRSYGSPGPLRGMKLHVTEGGYRVPGILRWPGHARPGTTSAEPVCNLDLLPTFCEIAGIRPPSDRALDGASILPIFEGKPVVRPHPLYWQYDFAISRPWEVSLRDGPWKLLADKTLDRFELYNLSDDSGEARNVADEHPDLVRTMAAEMKRLHAEIEAEDGFTPLFDGKTLRGWTIDCLPKDKEFAAKAWTVDRGTILANTIGRKEHFYILLATEKEYGDFVLRLRFQVERKVTGNSGIQIRSRYVPETGWMEGPQIDINPPDPQTTGKLWNEGPGPHRWLSNEPVRGFKFFYADQGDGWNDMEITAKGMKIKSVLNGVTVVDYDGSGVLDDELHKKHHVGTKGVIGLQIHSNDELKLRFKDIRIKELSR